MVINPRQKMVNSNKYNIKCPYQMTAKYITFHNTANDASAENEISYMINNNNQVSYHFAVDDKEVVQGIPLNRNAWHCGDGNGSGNRQSIGVEVCYSKSGGEKYRKAEKLAIKFIAQLLHERGWGIDRVKKHQDWSGKYCPHRVLDEGRWNDVKKAIEKELNSLKGIKSKPKQKPVSNPKTSTYKGNSLVDYLVSIKEDHSFANRSKLASKYGIKNYKGTATQNTQLLNAMRDGKKPSKPASKPKPSNSGKHGKLKIINVNNAAIVMDKPDRNNSKNLGTVKKGATLPLNGSVRGKNSSSGYWEVEYKGRLGYITGKYGKQV
ncbi:N-acetylmuramoyl-L-alanine amidase family protein [Oceanobacillus caeni]